MVKSEWLFGYRHYIFSSIDALVYSMSAITWVEWEAYFAEIRYTYENMCSTQSV